MLSQLLRSAIRTWRKQGFIRLLFATIQYLRRISRQMYGKYGFPHLQCLYYRFQYSHAAPCTNDILFIHPKDIDYLTIPRFRNLIRWGTYVRGGSWDIRECEYQLMLTSKYHRINEIEQRCLVPFDRYGLYNSSKKHFHDGVPWNETEFYNWLYSHPHPDLSKYKTQRFEKFDDLYERINHNGYRPQCSLDDVNVLEKYFSPPDEILINIGRNGELMLDDGRHRLITAKLLGVDSVPVRVLVRHEQWQRKRHRIATGTASTAEMERFGSHPDMQLLVQ